MHNMMQERWCLGADRPKIFIGKVIHTSVDGLRQRIALRLSCRIDSAFDRLKQFVHSGVVTFAGHLASRFVVDGE